MKQLSQQGKDNVLNETTALIALGAKRKPCRTMSVPPFFKLVVCAAAMRIGNTGVSREVREATKAMEVVALRSLPAGVGFKPPLSGIG
jgi:hypothetical protein